MVTFNGKEYAITQQLLDAATAYVKAFSPNASADEQNALIEKQLGAGVKLAVQDERKHHAKVLADKATIIAKDSEFVKHAHAAAKAFAQAKAKAGEFAAQVGVAFVPTRSGEGYVGRIAAHELNVSKLIALCGAVDIRVVQTDSASEDSMDPKDYVASIVADLPQLDTVYATFRTERQGAIDVAAPYLAQITNYTLGVTEDGSLVLTDATSGRKAGTGAEGERAKSGEVRSGTCAGKTYTGTARQIVAALQADKVAIPQTILSNPSHLFTDKCPKSLGFVPVVVSK